MKPVLIPVLAVLLGTAFAAAPVYAEEPGGEAAEESAANILEDEDVAALDSKGSGAFICCLVEEADEDEDIVLIGEDEDGLT